MKPSIPKGTRDFSPTEMVRRNFIFDTIKKVYQKYGFQQIETPAMENLTTLEGKYGEEGDKLLFRILNSGDAFKDLDLEELSNLTSRVDQLVSEIVEENKLDTNKEYPKEETLKLVKAKLSVEARKITEKGLRYDLTVPFARYVVMHQNEITFPFKRYQVQPVWRADRPQKGRYREFYQCDADVIGSTSLLNEVELIQIIDEVFARLGFQVTVKLNNRKILAGIAEQVGIDILGPQLNLLLNAIDEYEKIGQAAIDNLANKGFSNSTIEKLNELILYFSSGAIVHEGSIGLLQKLEEKFPENSIGRKGVEEFRTIYNLLNTVFGSKSISFTTNVKLGTFSNVTTSYQNVEKKLGIELDIWLARGLNYYTGTIIEIKVNDPRSQFRSSICGGGRYDDLTGIFGLPNVSGVGISFGVDRIYDVMDEMKLFDELKLSGATTKLLFVNFGNEEEKYCLGLLKQIREADINAELYPDAAKMKKQMGYADDNKIPFVCLVGSDEMKSGQLTVKNMVSGEQEKVSITQLISKLK